MAPKKKSIDELKDQRVPIMMSEDELKAIDDWSFANRIRSRGEAIRRLCSMGLAIDASILPFLELATEVFKRRMKDGEKYRAKRWANMPPELAAAQAKLDASTASLISLKDHARLVLALHAFAEPVLGFREIPEIEQALKEASSLGPKLKEITGDIEELKQDHDDDPDWLKEQLRSFREADNEEG